MNAQWAPGPDQLLGHDLGYVLAGLLAEWGAAGRAAGLSRIP